MVFTLNRVTAVTLTPWQQHRGKLRLWIRTHPGASPALSLLASRALAGASASSLQNRCRVSLEAFVPAVWRCSLLHPEVFRSHKMALGKRPDAFSSRLRFLLSRAPCS